MIPNEIKFILGLVALLLVVGDLGYCQYKAEKKGEDKIVRIDERAVSERAEQDAKIAEKVKSGYEAEIARLRALALQPAPVRVCHVPRGSSPEAPVTGRIETPSAAGGGIPEMSTIPAAGADIGPELQQLALRADELSAQVRALLNREKEL